MTEKAQWRTGKKVKPKYELEPEEWRAAALCAQIDVGDIFFPDKKGENPREAKAICEACEVKDPCLQYALRRPEWGIWGGTTARERQIMRRDLGIRLQPVITHGTAAGARAHYRAGEKPCQACARAQTLDGQMRRAQ